MKATLKGFGEGIDGIEVDVPDSLAPTQPTNSIDSELAEILTMLSMTYYDDPGGEVPTVAEALQAIKALYRKELEEAIGNTPNYNNKLSREYTAVNSDSSKAHKNGFRLGVREYQHALTAKLLPPTKGGNDE